MSLSRALTPARWQGNARLLRLLCSRRAFCQAADATRIQGHAPKADATARGAAGSERESDSSRQPECATVRETAESEGSNHGPCELRIATFNVLAPCYKRLPSTELRESDFPSLYRPRHAAILSMLREQRDLDILALQEFWFHDDVRSMYIEALGPGYHMHCLQRPKGRDDGVAVFVRNHIQVVGTRRLRFDDYGMRVALMLHLRIRSSDQPDMAFPPAHPNTHTSCDDAQAASPSQPGKEQISTANNSESGGDAPLATRDIASTDNLVGAQTKASAAAASSSSSSSPPVDARDIGRASVPHRPCPVSRGSVDLILANTHFSFPHSQQEHQARLQQAQVLAQRVDEFAQEQGVGTIILTGDFNGDVNSRSCAHLLSQGYKSMFSLIHQRELSVTHRTHRGEDVGVDFVFMRSDDHAFEGQAAYALPQLYPDQVWPEDFDLSDHRPVVVSLTAHLRDPASPSTPSP